MKANSYDDAKMMLCGWLGLDRLPDHFVGVITA